MSGSPPTKRNDSNDPTLDQAQRRKINLSIEHIHGPEEVHYEKDELIVLCLVRDGRPYVRSFVEHYLALGARHIVFLDNGSTDGTVETMKTYPQVTVLRTKLPYKKYKYTMKQYLIRRFGKKRWSLYVDIDELFDYPHSDVVSLSSLLGYLNRKSYTTVVAQMLDMFPEGPLSGNGPEKDVPLKEEHRFYDLANIKKSDYKRHPKIIGNKVSNEDIQTFNGGIRKTLFDVKTSLTKHPLIFLDDKIQPMQGSSHRTNYARVADFTGVLYHYKFLDDFYEKAVRAVQEGNYFSGSAQYKRYQEVLEENPSLQIKQDTSRRLESVNEIVKEGFLVVSKDYMAHAEGEEDKHLSELLREAPQELADAFLKLRIEARSSARKIRELQQDLHARDREIEELRSQQFPTASQEAQTLKTRNRRLLLRNRELERQIQLIRESRVWWLLRSLGRTKSAVLGALGKSDRKDG